MVISMEVTADETCAVQLLAEADWTIAESTGTVKPRVSLAGAASVMRIVPPWIGAPLAIIANVAVSFITGRDTPAEIKEFLATKVHSQ